MPSGADERGRAAGVQFPLVDGSRSTTATGTEVFAAAARAVSDDVAAAIGSERDWRHAYIHHLRAITAAEIADPEGSLGLPELALRALHERMVFVTEDGEVAIDDALEHPRDELATVTVRGQGERTDRLEVPHQGQVLHGDGLRQQLAAWVDAGVAEPSFAAAVGTVIDRPDWLELDDLRFVLFGAGAELGPLTQLSRWGAAVVAVDVPEAAVWERILGIAKAGVGTVAVPVKSPDPPDADDAHLATVAGADLTTDMPAIHRWVAGADGRLVLGNYVYADGADNVRVSMAVDTIVAALSRDRDVSLAVLATPTDVYAVPREAAKHSRDRFSRRGPLARSLATMSAGRFYAPNYPQDPEADGDFSIADAQVPQQGPNYALAKHLHRWRARDARRQGLVSSINVAPPTRTRSVTKNRLLAAAYRGAPRFDVEVFEPETANALMAAMLVHDLRHEDASSNPTRSLNHPLQQLTEAANHGGLWRIPFAPRSVLGIAAVGGLLTR